MSPNSDSFGIIGGRLALAPMLLPGRTGSLCGSIEGRSHNGVHRRSVALVDSLDHGALCRLLDFFGDVSSDSGIDRRLREWEDRTLWHGSRHRFCPALLASIL